MGVSLRGAHQQKKVIPYAKENIGTPPCHCNGRLSMWNFRGECATRRFIGNGWEAGHRHLRIADASAAHHQRAACAWAPHIPRVGPRQQRHRGRMGRSCGTALLRHYDPAGLRLSRFRRGNVRA